MRAIEKYSVEPKYRRENGVSVFDAADLPFPKNFELKETSVVQLPPGQVAGNHRHPRQEVYFCCDEGVELHWVDDAGKTHIELMAKAGDSPQMFVIPPFVPHAVVNISDRNATLLGYADNALENVEVVEVVAV